MMLANERGEDSGTYSVSSGDFAIREKAGGGKQTVGM